jgi:hypothetical protein
MTRLADELCAEVRAQCEAAEHFKGLWMQANEELERLKAECDNTFVVEYVRRGPDGVTLHHVALRDWPAWTNPVLSILNGGCTCLSGLGPDYCPVHAA